MEPDVEWLEGGPRGDRGTAWRPPRWLLGGVSLVAVLALAGWYGDHVSRLHEESALGMCRQALHNAAISADLQMVSVADNVRPALAASSGAQRVRIVSVLSNPARALLPVVARADRLCRAVQVWPWHRSLRAHRRSATAYSAALLAKVRRMAADGGDFYRDDRSLRHLRRVADLGVVGGRY